jgi:hypothetical protein
MPSVPRASARPGRTVSLRHRAALVANNVWAERSARMGLAARGVVYLVLAYLIARIALGALGQVSVPRPANAPGIAETIAAQTDGRIALVVLGIGLIPYALFGAIDAMLHHDDETSTARRWGDRLLSLWSIIAYGAFGILCFVAAASPRTVRQRPVESHRQDSQWSADVLRWPVGWLWLGLLGVALLLIAMSTLWRCISATFRDWLHREQMTPTAWHWAIALGAGGYLGRAGLFAIVGIFVLNAAIENDPRQGQGVDGSIRLFANSAPGPYLLWLLAVAVGAYGLYAFVEARYRRV